MSPTHQTPHSPLSPLPSSRPESFNPWSHYHDPAAVTKAQQSHPQPQHQHPTQPEEPTVSPLGASWPDSPTLGNLSPVSLISPSPSLPPDPLQANRTPPLAASRSTPTVPAPETLPQEIQITRGGTVCVQNDNASKAATTRFPRRKPVASTRSWVPVEGEAESTRPVTLYLVDHSPHRVAPAPSAPIKRPHYANGLSYYGGRDCDAVDGDGFEDVELREPAPRARSASRGSCGGNYAQRSRVRNSVGGDGGGRDVEGNGEGRSKEEKEARNRDWFILEVLIFALVIAVVLFAVLLSQVYKLDWVAG